MFGKTEKRRNCPTVICLIVEFTLKKYKKRFTTAVNKVD